MEITPVLPIAGQKFSRYFMGYLKFFTTFKYFFFHSTVTPHTTLKDVLVGKHCLELWDIKLTFQSTLSQQFSVTQ